MALEILITASSSPVAFSWTTPKWAALVRLHVRDTHTNLGSAIAGVGVGGVNKLLNLSGLVIGAFLQMRMLSIMIPLIRGTWFSLKQYPGAGSQMGKEKCRKDVMGGKRCKVV